MNQYFDSVMIHARHHALHELTFKDAIQISRIPEHLNEKRLTKFLQCVLHNDDLPLSLTVQERYYTLLKYLSQQSDGLISAKMDYAAYIQSDDAGIDVIHESTIRVQHLTGTMVEFLEAHCTGIGDWLVGLMALQLEVSDLPACSALVAHDLPAASMLTALKQRIDALQCLPQSAFNRIYQQYRQQNCQLNTLMHLGFDQHGITVHGGADDAPVRFRPSAAFIGIAAELERFATATSRSTVGGR